MVAVAFRFPAGRYHATPWGRHVNEAEVEWPPSPWRILRALIATYYRKGWDERYPVEILDALLESLAEQPPAYRLPPAVRAHSRHYMPQGRFKAGREDTSLIFDAFARIAPGEVLVAYWPVELAEEQQALLAALLSDLGFLGRAESWAEGELLEGWEGELNCRSSSSLAVDPETGEVLEPIRLLAPVAPTEYTHWRTEIVAAYGLEAQRLKKSQQRIVDTLPKTLAGALRAESGALQQAGWSLPPGAQYLTYQRLSSTFAPSRRARRRYRQRPHATTARLALAGKPLPRIEDAVRIGELTRLAAIKKAEQTSGHVPPALSGHDLPAGNRHGHAFYLPEDADGDGHIDHILVHAADGLTAEAVRALDRITRLWERDGGEWQVLFEGAGLVTDWSDPSYLGRACEWRTITPYLHPWFAKKRFGVPEQIARECRERGLLEPEVLIEEPPCEGPDGRWRRPAHFRRFRQKPRLRQPDTRGRFLVLTFPEPVVGPLALGFGCHFGLGALVPRC